MKNIFFHIDVNSAFLSWTAIRLLAEGETVDIRTIPAAIGGDMSKRTGCHSCKIHSGENFWRHYRGAHY